MTAVSDYVSEISDTASRRALTVLLEAVLADLTVLGTSVSGIATQLDADAGVTDTDYVANNDPTLSLTE